MSGIFGWIPQDKYIKNIKFDLRGIAERVSKVMAHRGPDGKGYAVFDFENNIFNENSALPNSFKTLLGHVRLSTMDSPLSERQPLHTGDGRYSIVYDGKVYNYVELRGELESEGVKFLTGSDAEVVMNSIIQWGEQALRRFNGMFAFAVFDAKENTLFCARDFFGIKPFYWHYGKMGLCFASELPALLEFPDMPRNVLASSVYKYLCFGETNEGDSCMLSGIYQIPPAHYIKIKLSEIELSAPVRYWKPDISARSKLSFSDASNRLKDMFLDSVRLHLRSGFPFGVALSGGIDSSSITCAVRYLEPQADLHTFSYIAKGSRLSEEHYVNIVTERTGAIAHNVEVSPKELLSDMDSIIYHLGEPFGSTSIYAQYRIFKLAKECGMKVTLDGQGADELLAGYPSYRRFRMATMVKNGNIMEAMKFWNSVSLKRNKKNAMLRSVFAILKSKFENTASRKQVFPDWLDIDAAKNDAARNPVSFNESIDRLYPSKNKLSQMLAWQLTWNGVPALLRHGDRNSMASSIESRVPFLTKDIAEFCLSLPEEYLLDMDFTSKSVFRAAMRGIAPDEILDRKDKIGFATPEQDWFSAVNTWVDETLNTAKNIPYLKIDAVKKDWRNVCKGTAKFDGRIWRWLNYIRWVEMFKVRNANS